MSVFILGVVDPVAVGVVAVASLVLLGGIVSSFLRRRREAWEKAVEKWDAGQTAAALVWLLREPRELDVAKLSDAAERAFGMKFNRGRKARVFQGPAVDQLIVRMPGITLGVINADGPYVEDVGDAADHIREFDFKQAIQEHDGWISIDLIGNVPEEGGREKAYRYIGKLAAELAGEDCIALYCHTTDKMNSYGPDMLPVLRGEEPLGALTLEREDKVVYVADDDPRMLAATAEARRRWPEFVAAFEGRKEKQGFAVKVPFRDEGGEECEFMWVEVMAIEGPTLRGILVSEPVSVTSVKMEDRVTARVEDLCDWMYSDGREMAGGFTAKVLEEAEKQAQGEVENKG